MPQGSYLPEGSISLSAISAYTQSEAGMLKAIETGVILEGVVVRCDNNHNLYCDVGNFKGIIYRKEATLDEGVNSEEIHVLIKVDITV